MQSNVLQNVNHGFLMFLAFAPKVFNFAFRLSRSTLMQGVQAYYLILLINIQYVFKPVENRGAGQ